MTDYMLETVILLLFLLSFSAFSSAVETAYFSLSRGQVRTMVRSRLAGARLVEKLKSDPRKFLITILTTNNLVNILIATLSTELALSLFGSRGVALATGFVTFFVLVFGEIVPKTIAQNHAGKVSRYSGPIILILELILYPAIWFFKKLIDILSVGKIKNTATTNVVEEEIQSLLHIGVEEGSIEKHEKDFAERLFRFNDILISSVMKKIDIVVMLDADSKVSSATESVINLGYSRFPVFKRRKDNVVGLVHIKDIMKANNNEKLKNKKVSFITHPMLAVSCYDKLSDVFWKMTKEREHYALTKDIFGKTVGVVTMEDLLEELLGEIYDESDICKRGIIT